MINGLSFDVEDWYQVENLRAACPVENWDKYESRVERNTYIILDLLSKYNQKATFFILGWIAERKPQLVKKIASLGHEIASHGCAHEIVYRITPEAFRSDLMLSCKILKSITSQEILGYRAPNFSITRDSLWAVDILKESGFLYDSSVFPTSFHDRYGFEGKSDSRFFKFENGLQEFPLTVYRWCGMNFPLAGGGYFRLAPYSFFKFLLRKINRSDNCFIFYLHPWEIDSQQPRVQIGAKSGFRHYLNLNKTLRRLEHLLQDFKFQPLRSFLK